MAKYIDVDNYCKNICRCAKEHCDKNKCPILTAPAADVVEVKHGEWEFTGRKLTCSVCGHKAYIGTDDKGLLKEEATLRKYCFHCGAKMDGEHNER